ncbi:hypothetical protein QR685DRAFT_568264 [Neurospora intermedia]|uniref:Uncharacterized protein n=1 Tax=Neurospora intermedia TaxID=5142 RepID=A0ABR3DS35_NEUIN
MDTAIRLLPRLTPDKSLPQLSNGPCSVAEKARDLTPGRPQERAGTKMGFNPGSAQWTRLLKMAGQCRLEIFLSK